MLDGLAWPSQGSGGSEEPRDSWPRGQTRKRNRFSLEPVPTRNYLLPAQGVEPRSRGTVTRVSTDLDQEDRNLVQNPDKLGPRIQCVPFSLVGVCTRLAVKSEAMCEVVF